MQAAKAGAPSLLSAPRSRVGRPRKVARAEQKDTATEAEVENSTVKSDFKGGPFTVRSDMIGAVLGSSLNVPFRFGSGALVKG